ncbi:Dicer-like protein 2 [Exophiala dermatitidis]
MDLQSDDCWSSTSEEDEEERHGPIRSRAYQIEMFEHSMKGNVIVVMGTGTGKTQVAKLRIEAEFERSPTKRIWFTAPSVGLAYQQHCFLSWQLPAFQFRLITGMDNAEFWDTQEVWDKALHNINVVVSTPAILLQALDGGFVSMKTISLLVVDEAHHCVAKSLVNTIMKVHYHPVKKANCPYELPHILGLSASPITKKSPAEITELEANLDAQCKTPLQQLEEYTAFVNMPEIVILTFDEQTTPDARLLTQLSSLVSDLRFTDDPITKILQEKDDQKAAEKLRKIIHEGATPAMTELNTFLRSATTIQQDLGRWACETYITACVRKLHCAVRNAAGLQIHPGLTHDNRPFMEATLRPLHASLGAPGCGSLCSPEVLSAKVAILLNFLRKEYRSDVRGLIFVQARHTAWALTEVINSHPATSNYRAFSFVGVSNPAYRGSFDFAQLHIQFENLEKFRRGQLNLCIATSVLEEGIDVPSMNLVISFDARPNLRSFVQSRGRARQRNSKYVVLRSALEPSSKIKSLEALAAEMERECESSLRDLEARKVVESLKEEGGSIFRVPSTGATLTFDNARQSLQRFCSKLPRDADSEPPEPIFCLEGEIGLRVFAKLYLPTCLPPHLHVVSSQMGWQTERMAKKDAAFHAYLGLYKAGLVNENLQPIHWPKDGNGEAEPDIETRESTYVVLQQYNPWPAVMEQWAKTNTIYAHQLHVKDKNGAKPALSLLLPLKLSGTEFCLYDTDFGDLQVCLSPGEELTNYPALDLARKTSLHLLSTVLGRRLRGFERDQFPFLLVPVCEPLLLEQSHELITTNRGLLDVCATEGLLDQEYLVIPSNEQIPYVYQPSKDQLGSRVTSIDGRITDILATKLSRRLEFLGPVANPTSALPPQQRSLPVDQCVLLGVPVDYARLMLLVPSITHMLEVCIRTAAACQGPLAGLPLVDMDLVSEALTLPRVGPRNYERLEFLGDDLLKFYTSIQVFVDNPTYPESGLTIARNRIVNNARLQRATRTLALEQFLTQHRFSGAEWTAGVSKEDRDGNGDSTDTVAHGEKTHLSSKTLADVVEALIGAASLNGSTTTTDADNIESRSQEGVIAALQLFLEEVPWRPVSENLARIHVMDDSEITGYQLYAPVEPLIGYRFTRHALLAEALTQSWLGGQVSSYDRLEFLGDAVLDHIVKQALFHNSTDVESTTSPLSRVEQQHQFDPEEMTLRRHALASHATLAFFAFQASYTSNAIEIATDPFTRKTTISTNPTSTSTTSTTKTVYLFDHVRRSGNRDDPLQREGTLAAYHDVRDTVLQAFKHGAKFPWAELLHIGAPKMYSDIIESLLGAIFIDSSGDLGACVGFLERLGFMDLVRRFANTKQKAGLDLIHPEHLLSQVQPGCKFVTYQSKKRAATGGEFGAASQRAWKCKVLLDGERIAHAKRGSCKAEAQCRAAQRAAEVLLKKRDHKRKAAEISTQGGDGACVVAPVAA